MRLNGDVKCDVAVIGGGIAGLMLAYELERRGKKVALFEAGEIVTGDTARSSAMLSFVHDAVYARLISKHGEETAREYYRANSGALNKIMRIVTENGIDCGFNQCAMFLFSSTEKGTKELEKEHAAYLKLGIEAEYSEIGELPLRYEKALRIPGQAYFDPVRFCVGLAGILAERGVSIYEHAHVSEEPQGNTLKAGGFTITADSFVIATHYPYINITGLIFAKMYQHRSYNVVFDAGFRLRNIYESVEDDGYEYRPFCETVLCGGGAARTGKYNKKSGYHSVERHIEENFPKARVLDKCAAQDCMTMDLLPYAGRLSHFLNGNVYMITGFNKWGFTNAVACAETVADKIEGKTDESIFDTARAECFTSPVETVKNLGDIVAGFAGLVLKDNLKSVKNLQPGEGAIVRQGGKRLGVYRDRSGKLKAVSAVCPHMGCSLNWNSEECSWDCKCHGSRFDTDGNILNNPTLKRAEKAEAGLE